MTIKQHDSAAENDAYPIYSPHFLPPSFTTQLDSDSLLEVFERLVEMAPIHNAVALRSINWQVCRAVNFALWKCDQISIEVKFHEDRKVHCVYIQGSPIGTTEKALECLDFMLSHARCVRVLTINVEVPVTEVLEQLLEKFLTAQNVRLEVLKIRRRYVGQSFPVLAELISQNAETLKVLGKVGLSEAVAGFTENLHLERLSLMNFDLVEDGELNCAGLMEKTRSCIRRLAGIGAKFDHLSYTCYTGFDMSKNPTHYMLKSCEVRSLRLTMQEGYAVSEVPTSGALLNGLQRLELVGCLDIPRNNLSVLFPNLEYFDFQKEDLATGSSSPEPHMDEDSLRFEESSASAPIAAAC
jgi:hypothetical protein